MNKDNANRATSNIEVNGNETIGNLSSALQHTHAINLRRWLPALFGILDEDYLENLIAHKVQFLELSGNETLFSQGSEGSNIYILISGRLQAIKTTAGQNPQILNDIKQGELVGELAVISGKKHSASIVATRDSILAYISRDTYFDIAEHFPHHTLYLTNTIIKRLTADYKPNKSLRERWNIALIPASSSVNIADFAHSIKPYLQKHGRTLHLNNALINDYLGYENIAQVGKENSDLYHKLTFWIDRYEAQYNFIVYEADNKPSEWTERCLRQADEIIYVADSRDACGLSNLEKQIVEKHKNINTHQTLVLLHPASVKEPRNTKDWLDCRPHCSRHQHIRLENESDCERLARYMSGQTVAWVLSGGAARGIAHIGVVKAFREANIPVDIIGGTSFGSLVGAGIALGWTTEEMAAAAERSFQTSPTSDFNWLPILSIVKGKKIEKMLKNLFGDSHIEDTWLNNYCIASNISKARLQFFKQGLMRQAIRASISLPGVLPPVLYDGDFLIDGGIFDNLPIEPMIEQYQANKIIAVEVGYMQKPSFTHENIPTNAQLLRDSFRSAENRRYNMPNFLSNIVESVTLCSDYKTAQFADKVDLLLRPDLTKYGAADWKKYKEMIEDGYIYASKFLEKTDIKF